MDGILGGHGLLAWGAFHLLVFVLLAIDLGSFNRQSRVMALREAAIWNVVWTGVGLTFAGVVFRLYGHQAGVEYVTGYVVERALSVDNIFVFVIIFRYFAVPPEHHRRVLYWGILGALVLRGGLILTGAAIVAVFHWLLYDMCIPGCPIDKSEFLGAVSKLVAGRHPYLYKFPVCTECKWRENPCILYAGRFCAGPLTKGGCGAVCPSHNVPCVGCWGPTDDLNVTAEYQLLKEKGYKPEEIIQKIKKFGGAKVAELVKDLEKKEGKK